MFGDSTVLPSYLSSVQRGNETALSKMNDNVLRIGEIKKLVYPDDTNSISKQFLEYAVEVVVKDGSGPPTTTIYVGCVLSNLFGGWADRVRYTLRADTQNTQTTKSNIYGVGSKVLMLCINGETDNCIILSGVPDVGTQPEQKETNEGHNLLFEFNGTQFTINKDGELKLTFRGATKADGELTDNAIKEAEGSYVQISKEGNIKVATPDDDQFIHINHKDKKVEMQAQKEWNVAIKGAVNITADQNVNIKSSGVMVGDATDAWLLATTYRNAETQLNTQISAAAATLTSLLATAGASMLAAAALNAIPVVGGGLASPGFIAAGTSLTSAAPIFTQIQTALTTFEAQAASYLSKKNKND